jgi:nucleotide-binding universal stress UspA family protein
MFKKPPVRHILVLVDSTETSARAVDLAAALARALHARLTGIAIIETETLHQLLSAKVLTDAEMGDFEAGLRESAARQLDAARARAHEQGAALETAILAGNSEVVVPQEVATRGVDLIVMGGFDSSQVRFELLFRQRQQIVDHAPCPVLISR